MDDRVTRVESFFEVPALAAAALVIPDLVIEGSDLSGAWDTTTALLNWLIWLVFAAELVALLVVVPNRRDWALHHPLEVAIVVLTPPFLPPRCSRRARCGCSACCDCCDWRRSRGASSPSRACVSPGCSR